MTLFTTSGLHGVAVPLTVTFGSAAIGGLPAAYSKEVRMRVRAGLASVGHNWTDGTVIVGDKPASAGHYDLAIAMELLDRAGKVPSLHSLTVFVGELSLGGMVRPVPGALPIALAAKAAGYRKLYVAAECSNEAMAAGIEVVPVRSLAECVALVKGQDEPVPYPMTTRDPYALVDMRQVYGQEHAKRALEVAAAGNHNVLFVGPPGAGATLMAMRLTSIMPSLTEQEAVAVTCLHSVAGLTRAGQGLTSQRPFRAPHYTASTAAVAGSHLAPGEVSLAHHGVLFLDELTEFRGVSVDAIFDAVKAGQVEHKGHTFPARALVVGHALPCACGRGGRLPEHPPCTCTPEQLAVYKARLQKLARNFDIIVELAPVPMNVAAEGPTGETSEAIRARVIRARAFQQLEPRSALSRVAVTSASLDQAHDVGEAHMLEAAHLTRGL